MESDERRMRAEARRHTAVLHRTLLQAVELDLDPVDGERAVSLVTTLSRESWSASSTPLPEYSREQVPVRFVAGRLT